MQSIAWQRGHDLCICIAIQGPQTEWQASSLAVDECVAVRVQWLGSKWRCLCVLLPGCAGATPPLLGYRHALTRLPAVLSGCAQTWARVNIRLITARPRAASKTGPCRLGAPVHWQRINKGVWLGREQTQQLHGSNYHVCQSADV